MKFDMLVLLVCLKRTWLRLPVGISLSFEALACGAFEDVARGGDSTNRCESNPLIAECGFTFAPAGSTRDVGMLGIFVLESWVRSSVFEVGFLFGRSKLVGGRFKVLERVSWSWGLHTS